MNEIKFQDLTNDIFMYSNVFEKHEDIVPILEDESRVLWLKNKIEQQNATLQTKNMNCLNSMNLEIDMEDFSLICRKLMLTFISYMNHYCKTNEVNVYSYQSINFLKYKTGHYFELHTDSTEYNNFFLSLVYCVNDDYEGGEFYFPEND